MRLWSIHPRYLDSRGLVALWREALLAQAVLRGETKGYRNHPQLVRFKNHTTPNTLISRYLQSVHSEALARGYAFDRSKIQPAEGEFTLPMTTGQIVYEWAHLMAKLSVRQPELHRKWAGVDSPALHTLFTIREGEIEEWERYP